MHSKHKIHEKMYLYLHTIIYSKIIHLYNPIIQCDKEINTINMHKQIFLSYSENLVD